MLIRPYSEVEFPLREIVRRLIGYPLATLHQVSDRSGSHDQDTDFHQVIYGRLSEEFFRIYDGFMRMVARGLKSDEPWAYQRIPTFRFQFPMATGTKEFHRDRDYHHSIHTLNVVVPLTPMLDSTAIWTEVAPYTGSYQPNPIDVGHYGVFDGANVKHGTYINLKSFTRVSFDARLLPQSKIPQGSTVNQRMSFSDYYRGMN